MIGDRKENDSLPEKLIRAYQQSNPSLDFGETQHQLMALEWVDRMMSQLKENEQKDKRNGR
jgi:hypothetical protein